MAKDEIEIDLDGEADKAGAGKPSGAPKPEAGLRPNPYSAASALPSASDLEAAGLRKPSSQRGLKIAASVAAAVALAAAFVIRGAQESPGSKPAGQADAGEPKAAPTSGTSGSPEPPQPKEGDGVPAPGSITVDCTYDASATMTCSGGLPQPLEEETKWLPENQQLPPPAPAKGFVRITAPDGTVYISPVQNIDYGKPGSLSGLPLTPEASDEDEK